jgi:hypothetical protein
MQFRRIFGLKSDETEIGIASTDDGRLKVDADISGGLDSVDPATQTTLAAVLAKIIAAPSTEAKQDLIITALGLIGTEATTGDIKTATEALAALISAGALSVSLGELPDTAGGDLADINTASTSIDGKLPALSGGKIPVVATIGVAEVTPKVLLYAPIDFSSASAQTIIAAPGAGNRIRLTRLSLMSGGTPQVNVEIALKSGASLIETMKGAVMVSDYHEHRNLGTNEAFVVQCTSADRVIGGADYYVEAV